ncbi:9849_t:CDS:2, partial [Ambispora gerdemannii]
NQEIQENEENEESGEIEAEPEETIDLILDEDFDDDESPDLSSLEADFGIEEENGEMLSSEIGNIIHPAVDDNAKWDLNILFNELQLP